MKITENSQKQAYQEYKNISGLSDKDMNTWIKINPFVNEWIINNAKELSR